jgi:hypothetical protein
MATRGTHHRYVFDVGDGPLTPYDAMPPELHCALPDGQWHASDVSLACTAADGQSGLANPADAVFSLSTHVATGTETSNALTDSRQACDKADNCAAVGPLGGNKVDRKPPAVTIAAPSGTYVLGQAVAANYATDNAGNRNAATVSYTVGYGIRPLYTVVAKQSGSAYPIKLQLIDANGNNVSSPQVAVHAVGVMLASSSASRPLLTAGNANPDMDFRYDAALGGYILNLKLTGYATGSYSLQFMAGNDSAVHNALFQVK